MKLRKKPGEMWFERISEINTFVWIRIIWLGLRHLFSQERNYPIEFIMSNAMMSQAVWVENYWTKEGLAYDLQSMIQQLVFSMCIFLQDNQISVRKWHPYKTFTRMSFRKKAWQLTNEIRFRSQTRWSLLVTWILESIERVETARMLLMRSSTCKRDYNCSKLNRSCNQIYSRMICSLEF